MATPPAQAPIPSAAFVREKLLACLRFIPRDLVLAAAITAIAAVPRLVLLGQIPPGLHGDEAAFGVEARRILETGNIGIMSVVGTGTPAGTFYWTAALFELFGSSLYTLRLSYALLGILTIPIAYFAYRVMFDRSIAILGALLLACSAWHIHYSRVAHVPIAWPLVEAATMLALFSALRSERRLLFGFAGAALAAGIYTYGGYPIFAVGIGGFLIWLAVFHYRERLRQFLWWLCVLAGVALLVGLPMASYAYHNPTNYLRTNRTRSVTSDAEYRATNGLDERAHLLVNREWEYLRRLTVAPRTDSVDGAGVFPLVSWALLALLVPGAAICFLRWRSPPHAFLLITSLVIGLAPVVTSGAIYRRTLGLTPLLAVIAALPLAWLWERARGRRAVTVAAAAFIALTVAVTGSIDLTRYFTSYEDDALVNYVYATDLRDASELLARLPDKPYVYFYAGRWGFGYAPRVFLAPDFKGEDRSKEFGQFRLDADRSRDVIYLFLWPYFDQKENVQQRYPGGTTFERRYKSGVVEYEAYLLPRLPGAVAPTPVPTRTPEDTARSDRDEVRVRDLASLRRAVDQYGAQHGSYPDTGGTVQPVCALPTSGVDCILSDVLDPLPADPLGNAGVNGYWYSSDGKTFALYGQRESVLFPPCRQHPRALQAFQSLLCVNGP